MAVERVAQPDFLEGVRAALVDKDRQPRWVAAVHPVVAGSDTKISSNRIGSGRAAMSREDQQQLQVVAAACDIVEAEEEDVLMWWAKCSMKAKQDAAGQKQQPLSKQLIGLCLQEVKDTLSMETN